MLTKRVFFALMIAVLVLPASLPRVRGQDAPVITVSLTPYEGNPILTLGELGSWDMHGIGIPRVIYADGLFHMFYSGWTIESGHAVTAIGYATSEDGLNWTKYEQNPVFALDDAVAYSGVLNASVLLEGETWVMYFTPSSETGSPTNAVLRATALSPTGPWTADPQPVLILGTNQDWDNRNGLAVDSILRTDEGYLLYYTVIKNVIHNSPFYTGGGIGRAVSPDGIHWTKYDDPITTFGGFAASDPVFLKNPHFAWDSSAVGEPVVRLSENGWEMFYYGSTGTYWSIGYATSEDGIAWTRYGDAPILTAIGTGFGPGSLLVIDDTYYLYYNIYSAHGDTGHYADTAKTDTGHIGLSTGTVTRE